MVEERGDLVEPEGVNAGPPVDEGPPVTAGESGAGPDRSGDPSGGAPVGGGKGELLSGPEANRAQVGEAPPQPGLELEAGEG